VCDNPQPIARVVFIWGNGTDTQLITIGWNIRLQADMDPEDILKLLIAEFTRKLVDVRDYVWENSTFITMFFSTMCAICDGIMLPYIAATYEMQTLNDEAAHKILAPAHVLVAARAAEHYMEGWLESLLDLEETDPQFYNPSSWDEGNFYSLN
jgi:hypothetical protein